MKLINKTQRCSGFSLLEMLLTVFIVAGLFIAILNVLQSYGERMLAKSTAEYIQTVSKSVDNILAIPAYYQALYRDADASPNNIIEIPFNNLINGFTTTSVPNIAIPSSDILSAQYSNFTPLKTTISVILRVADNVNGQAMEMMIVTNDRIENAKIERAADFLDGYGGVLDNTSSANSSFAAWSIPFASFAGTVWSATVLSNPPSNANGIYLVYYKHRPFDDIAGDYLYRQAVLGKPELNRMYSALNMGNNNILGVDDLNTQGDLDVSAKVIINGNMRVGGNAILENSDLTAGELFSARNATIRGTGGGTTGNLNVQGNSNIDRLRSSARLEAQQASFEAGFDTSSDLRVDTAKVTNNITSQQNINVTNLSSTAGAGGNGLNIISGGQFNADSVTVTGGFNVNGSNDVGTLNAIARQNATFNGGVRADTISIGTLNTATFGRCDNGC